MENIEARDYEKIEPSSLAGSQKTGRTEARIFFELW